VFPGPRLSLGVITIAFYMDHFGFGNFRLKSTTKNIATPGSPSLHTLVQLIQPLPCLGGPPSIPQKLRVFILNLDRLVCAV